MWVAIEELQMYRGNSELVKIGITQFKAETVKYSKIMSRIELEKMRKKLMGYYWLLIKNWL